MSSDLRAGGLVRFYARPGSLLAWTVPLWATVCGAVASGGLSPALRQAQGGLLAGGVRLLLVLLLAEAGWGALWESLATTDWRASFRRWRDFRFTGGVSFLPYTRPGSPGDRLAHWLIQFGDWWSGALVPTSGAAPQMALVGLALSLIFAAALGPRLLTLTGGALATMLLAVLLKRGRGVPGSGWDSVLRLGLPWLAGHLAFGPVALPSVGLAAAFTLAVAGSSGGAGGKVAWVAGQLAAAALVLALYHPVIVALLALLIVPQLLMASQLEPRRWARPAWPWLAAGMLLAALAL